MPDNSTTSTVAQPSLRVDRGARFYKCDFQVHTPRDSGWAGEFSAITSEADRKTYAKAFVAEVRRLGTDKDLHGVTKALGSLCANPEEAEPGKRYLMKDHFILLPHVRKHGMKTLLRDGMHTTYAEMPCVGGYIEGRFYSDLDESNRFILEGRNREYGFKKVAVFQTSDCREARKVTDVSGEWFDFVELGAWPTWVKWTEPSAEALRQACLASASRVAHTEPQLP